MTTSPRHPSTAPASEDERPPRRRRIASRVAGLALGLLVGLGICELLVRWKVGAPLAERTPLLRVEANPHRGWAMVPSEPHYTYLHPVTMNALGLRGAEVPEAKAAGEVRVLVLGDSLTYGQGVADEDTVPARLEDALRASAPDRTWRVVNAGHRGYTLSQSLGLFEELGTRIAPDVVLLLWYWNDLDFVDAGAIHKRLSGSGPVTFDVNAPFEGLTALRWHGKQLLRRSALIMYVHELRKSTGGLPPAAYGQKGLEALGGFLDEFIARCAALGARPVFAIVPDVGSLSAPHWTDPIVQGAATIANERGLEVVELKPALAPLAADGTPPILAYDGHYDANGNRAMAELLAAPVEAAAR